MEGGGRDEKTKREKDLTLHVKRVTNERRIPFFAAQSRSDENIRRDDDGRLLSAHHSNQEPIAELQTGPHDVDLYVRHQTFVITVCTFAEAQGRR